MHLPVPVVAKLVSEHKAGLRVSIALADSGCFEAALRVGVSYVIELASSHHREAGFRVGVLSTCQFTPL